MSFHILFVCSGNTCRSPLAEVVAQRVLEEESGLDFRVSSAGTFAIEDDEASAGSRDVAKENGYDLGSFRSRRLTAATVDAADLVLVMEPGHRSSVLGLSPQSDTKTFLLGELSGKKGEAAVVPDPFGGPIDAYRKTFGRLEALIRAGLPRIEVLADEKAEGSRER